jgi:hypothetical protein
MLKSKILLSRFFLRHAVTLGIRSKNNRSCIAVIKNNPPTKRVRPQQAAAFLRIRATDFSTKFQVWDKDNAPF